MTGDGCPIVQLPSASVRRPTKTFAVESIWDARSWDLNYRPPATRLGLGLGLFAALCAAKLGC
jgi:hypothetical protein